ncbi:MAG TPA: RHS repeat-associated core domain-containing protein, partial [Candidatus Polarisedimenticolia bacterium]|nr:RHS repeat-associated core domain-containing protein [Candidatus Polarisedimenticolia bacterium]
DSFGQVVERYRYDAYGQVTFLSPTGTPLTGSAVLNNVLFTGRYLDVESGLYYFRARTYHPYLGRFLQRDPLGEAASLNLYSYVSNNPVNRIDPSGMADMTPEQIADTERAHAALKAGIGREGARAMADYDMGVVTGAQGRDMEGAYRAGVARLSAEAWARWNARRDAKRLVKLKAELETQGKDPDNQKALQNLKGVKINELGYAQNAAKEAAGKDDKSELDTKSADDRLAGNYTLTLTSKYMMKPGHFGEVSEAALQMVADVVKSVTDTLCGNVPVEINGFSRGAGPAVGLTNTLTGDGYNLPGGNMTLNLIDGYMSPNWSQVANTDVTVNMFLSTSHDLKSMAIGWGAALLGVGTREISWSGPGGTMNKFYLPVGHTQMDTYVPGALGMAPFQGY